MGFTWLKGAADRFVSATLLKRIVQRFAPPGELMPGIDGMELPTAFDWARSDPAIAKAISTWAAVMENEAAQTSTTTCASSLPTRA